MKIALVNYPDSSQASVYGLSELFEMANRAAAKLGVDVHFEVEILDHWSNTHFDVKTAVMIPPSGTGQYYLEPEPELLDWLKVQYSKGAILASACAGTFILAQTQLLTNKSCTTHWGLAPSLASQFPDIHVRQEAILINEGTIITAGGMMSWLDLGLELVSLFASPAVMRLLGKMLVIDTGPREQRFYQQFTPNFQHGDEVIVQIQHYINDHYQGKLSNKELAELSCLTERTLQRRFKKATGFNVNQYIQSLRVQKACDLLESTTLTFYAISFRVGYQDVSAFRKIFNRIVGLTPKSFRSRFCS
ncbi:helix-turn-helix domain-containing protein [Vibrio alginolyticus]|uniref:GlxA family transcriptional regulator n=2 Tax=Vibrio harveyi group TaxID=717610 RepID=UPI00215E59C7|nr:helix-turn-helix domain-containing protein [Vibrio alginolyticus]MCS0252877.1 helix-turn-helix domain-containing protein [Vibrio alginolyticus]